MGVPFHVATKVPFLVAISKYGQYAPSSRLVLAVRGIVTTASRCDAGFHHGLLRALAAGRWRTGYRAGLVPQRETAARIVGSRGTGLITHADLRQPILQDVFERFRIGRGGSDMRIACGDLARARAVRSHRDARFGRLRF